MGDPNCSAAMLWLSDHWQGITFQGKPLDGSICGLQQYLHIQDGVCPPPDNKLMCQNEICVVSPTQSPTYSPSAAPTKFGETRAPTPPPTVQGQTFSPTHDDSNVQENPKPSKTSNSTTWIIIFSIFGLLIIVGLILYFRQRGLKRRVSQEHLLHSDSVGEYLPPRFPLTTKSSSIGRIN